MDRQEFLEETKLDEYLQQLNEISPVAIGIGAILGLRHIMKKGRNRDIMLTCQNDCIRSKNREEWEKCVADCFNRKSTLANNRYKMVLSGDKYKLVKREENV